MTERTIIKNISIINEGQIVVQNLLIDHGIIQKIGHFDEDNDSKIIDGTGKYLFPGIIDGQVHFREPGLTHKGDLYTESKAAIAGGVTSFIDMPNTFPNVLTIDILNEKYQGNGYMSKIFPAFLNYGFKTREEIMAVISKDNIKSQNFIKKFGFELFNEYKTENVYKKSYKS